MDRTEGGLVVVPRFYWFHNIGKYLFQGSKQGTKVFHIAKEQVPRGPGSVGELSSGLSGVTSLCHRRVQSAEVCKTPADVGGDGRLPSGGLPTHQGGGSSGSPAGEREEKSGAWTARKRRGLLPDRSIVAPHALWARHIKLNSGGSVRQKCHKKRSFFCQANLTND